MWELLERDITALSGFQGGIGLHRCMLLSKLNDKLMTYVFHCT